MWGVAPANRLQPFLTSFVVSQTLSTVQNVKTIDQVVFVRRVPENRILP
jgi:hypothetical protein